MWKRIVIALSFATFCFLNTWIELAQGRATYFTRYDPRTTVALPVICCELVIAAVSLGVYRALRRFRVAPWMRNLLLIGACTIPAGIASLAVLRLSPVNLIPALRHPLFWPIALPGIAVIGTAAIRWSPSTSRLVRGALLYAWPVLSLIVFTAGFRGLSQPADAFHNRPLAPRLGRTPDVRVVWVVFDELSRGIAFDRRPRDLALPNFDRLKSESFYATAAKPPGNMTLECMPSLLLGHQVTAATPHGTDELELKTNRGIERFGAAPGGNVFDDVRAMHYDTGLAGWYHPYCRVLNNSLTDCFWVANWLDSAIAEPGRPQSIAAGMRVQTLLHFTSIPLIGHVPGVFPDHSMRVAMAERTEELLAHAANMIANPSMALVLVHIPVPHPPAPFSRALGRIEPDANNGYADSLAHADIILGRLRTRIAAAGLANRTALIVTSDHGWRDYVWRGSRDWTAEDERLAHGELMGVPFLVKLPAESSASVYTKPFMTTVTRALIDGILKGEICTPDGIINSIEHAAADGTAPAARL